MQFRKKLSAAALAAVTALGLGATAAHAATALQYTEHPFTVSEVSNWSADRTSPTGGYESVTFGDRSDVLEVRLDASSASAASFYRTEGLKRSVDSSDALKVDLYVDPAWLASDLPVRAGLWGVGHDAAGQVSAYPIAEFTTLRADGSTGWRVFDGVNGGWTSLEAPYTAGQWSTLEIFYSPDSSEFGISVNGTPTTSPAGDTVTLGEVILNQYNFGLEGGTDYAVRWSRFATGMLVQVAGSKDDCIGGGYAAYGFSNQGQCIASLVASDNSGH